jgi:sugar phosphate isomerase/epimerase
VHPLVWNTFPRSPETLEAAVRDMSELGYKGFETFGEVVEDWDKKGTLEKLIAQYKIPLISAYSTLNVIDPSVRNNEIATIVRWGKLLKKYGANFMVIAVGGASAGTFAAHRASIVVAERLRPWPISAWRACTSALGFGQTRVRSMRSWKASIRGSSSRPTSASCRKAAPTRRRS